VWLAPTLAIAAWFGAPANIARSQDRPEVDLALVLAVDCSYSVDNAEYRLQMGGLAAAFRDPRVAEAIGSGPLGRITVTLFQWSSHSSQKMVVPWTLLQGPGDAEALARKIEAAPRLTSEGATSISAAIDFGTGLIANVPARPLRRVIDVSADGGNNNGVRPEVARDRAIESAITINGLAIINEVPYLDSYFQRHVTGGPGRFVIVANDYAAYREAILRKLIREILGPTVS
jgi:hypothetical protein